MRISSFFRLTGFIFLLCSFLLSGINCGTQDEPQQTVQKKKVVKKKKKKKKKKIEVKQAADNATAKKQYSYDAAGKPDPFLPLIVEEAPRPQQTGLPHERKKKVPETPLQKYELGSLHLVAIINKQGASCALLEDSAGNGYIVKKGVLVGKNEGIIKKITNDEVIIEEKIYNDVGELVPRISSLIIEHKE